MRRLVSAMLAIAQFVSIVALGEVMTRVPARAAGFVCTGGSDGPGGTLSGQGANTYYQPPIGTVSAGSTSLPLGTLDTGGGGGSTAIGAGDLALVIQMQDGTFTYSNTASYGTGASIANAGLYEYVQVTGVTAGTATIVGAGSGGGLINSYTRSAATGTHGQQTYQIIRVPQYSTATLSSTYTAAYWDGKTGGVAALDVASTLNLGGASVYASGDGFRGGGVSVAATSPAGVLNTDYVDSAAMNGANPSTAPPAMGFKGEGIFGTPDYTFGYTTFTNPASPAGPTIVKATSGNGYPGGDVAMGAPGNGGGGGTDMNPATNDSNDGGGGGSNGGNGGNGGYPWSSQNPKYSQTSPAVHTQANFATVDATHSPDLGGRGAAAIASGTRALMGGGGGAGSNNNGSNNNAFSADGSSGGTGGGIVLMRIAYTSGSPATIFADGTTGLAPDNDGGGGGGAGGTVIITSPNPFSGITVYARGAAGTSAYFASGDTTVTTAHGPGGGGGGGVVYSSSSVGANTSGGSNGVTVSGQALSYGATPGSAGISGTLSDASVPGAPSGASCFSSGGSGTATLYTGPVDGTEPTYFGADYTGSYDGSVTATNDNDFTATSMNLSNASATPTNTGTVPGTWLGSAFTFSVAPTVQIPHELYYVDTVRRRYHQLSLVAQAPVLPANWSVHVCPDNGANAPNCAAVNTGSCSTTADRNTWMTVTAASSVSTNTGVFCYYSGTTTPGVQQSVKYWTVYTPAAGTYTTFNRYDAFISASDDQATPALNNTHDEIYAGFVPITKTATIVTNGCPAGVTPPASGVCPGGTIRYALDFRNIMVGAGLGTEGQLLSAFDYVKAGSLIISDAGNATFTNGAATNNTATYTNGLASVMSGTAANYAACSATANSCGVHTDHDAGVGTTTFTGNVAGSTSWTATIGGASFQLVPSGYTLGANQATQGTITFAEVVK
jgi:hypothetical protein